MTGARSWRGTVVIPFQQPLTILVACCARSLFILPQPCQHFAETLLSRARGTALSSLASDIDQLRNAVPAGSAGNGILAIGQELLSFLASLGNALLLFGVVILVKVIDVLLRLLDSLLALGGELLLSLFDLSIAPLSPLLDDLWLLLVLCGRLIAGVVAD